jgi:hypothetical protein
MGVATSGVFLSCGVVGLLMASILWSSAFLGDAVFGVVDLPGLLDLGVVAFGVADFGVAVFGVEVFGVAALGVTVLGVVVLGVGDFGVIFSVLRGSGGATFGANALRGLCDLRCGLADIKGVSAFGTCSRCLTGVLRNCFSTLGDGSGSCNCV